MITVWLTSARNRMASLLLQAGATPLCNGTTYGQIEISRQSGKYRTEFYECTGCTVMLRHPARFARLGLPVRRWPADVEPRSLRDAHGFIVESDKLPKPE